MKITKNRWRRRLIGLLLGTAVLCGGYYGGRHVAWPAFKSWRVARMNRSAQEFLDHGDVANALLTARKSLQSTNQNPGAWRVAAKASEARERPEAVWYQDNLCREEPTKGNQLELLRLALHFNVPGYALAAVKQLEKSAPDDPEFHRRAAEIYQRIGQPQPAQEHLAALTRLAPGDAKAQLDLAELQLAADTQRKDTALRVRVLALAAKPDMRARALVLLLRDQLAGQSKTGVAPLVHDLEAVKDLSVADRLVLLEGLFFIGSAEAPQMLATLKQEASNQPTDAARVVDFMNRTGRAAEVRAWVTLLPATTRDNEVVQRSVAEALLTLRDPVALENFLRGGNWPKNEYLREALLAHAYRDQGKSADFAEAWRLAVIDAGTDVGKAVALLTRVDQWRWVSERYDVIWKLFALMPTNESVQRLLIGWERHQGNTSNLQRVFSRIVEVQPGDDQAKNNLAYTSLLLGSNVSRAGLIAADLAEKNPRNPFYKTTYALALYQQGHAAEAVAVLDKLTPLEQFDPMRMVIRALCLTALGRVDEATDLMNGAILKDLLPEEKNLVDRTRTEIARLDRTQGNATRLLAAERSQTGQAKSGWLGVVDAGTRKDASTDMQLADSLYATPDWNGLRDFLASTQWKERDYLRSALLAYASRQLGDLSRSQDTWRQALALADRDPVPLQNLRALATAWNWTPERYETINRLFDRNTSDRALLDELTAYYRETRRTTELARVLGLYLAETTDPTDDAVANAYYSLLLDANAARAHVMARNAFEAAPADVTRRMLYVFSLWKQRRSAEAMPLLAALKPGATSPLLSVPLLRALVQMQMGLSADAKKSLAQVNRETVLPEEATLADRLAGELAAKDGVVVSLSRQ